MTYEEMKKVEYRLVFAARENRERIDELHGYAAAKGLAESGTRFHETWMDWQEELWNRINWLTHQEYYLGMLRAKCESIKIEENDIKWTLNDYVYSK